MRVFIYLIGEDEPIATLDDVLSVIPKDDKYIIIFADCSSFAIKKRTYEIGV